MSDVRVLEVILGSHLFPYSSDEFLMRNQRLLTTRLSPNNVNEFNRSNAQGTMSLGGERYFPPKNNISMSAER